VSKASKKELNELHGALARVFRDCLENGQVVVDGDGVAQRVTPQAAILNAARQFLKDNNIESLDLGEQMGAVTVETLRKLPFTSSDDYGAH
jgi:hypothetical protein